MEPHRSGKAGTGRLMVSGVRTSAKGRGRRSGLAPVVCAILGLTGPAPAEEALFLRIRPRPDPAALGAAGGAQAAFAAREAIWERSNARARTILESVCTGCLRPWDTPSARFVTAAVTAPETPARDNPAPDDPAPKIPASPGVEPDPSLEASEPTPDPSFSERRP